MSLVALDWMLAKAERSGLRLLRDDRRTCREHSNMDDKLYDPRAGLGVFYRRRIRDVGKICREHGVLPKVHMSVLERLAHGTEDYAPGNIPPSAALVATPADETEQEALLEERARNLQAVLSAAHSGDDSLLARVKLALFMGTLSYYVYLAACLLMLISASSDGSPGDPWSLLKRTVQLLVALVASPLEGSAGVARQLVSNRRYDMWIAGGIAFAAAYGMMRYSDRTTSAVFSGFWHAARPGLRGALKAARQSCAPSRRADA
jgi:hypothetical protein